MIDAVEVPVEYQDYDSKEAEHADMIADNQIAELSHMDEDLLNELLDELQAAEFDLELIGISDDEIDLFVTSNETHDIDSFFETTEETPNDEPEKKVDYIECPKCGTMFT